MSQEEFDKLLKESGLPKEFSQKIDDLNRVVNDYGDRISFLESRVEVLNDKKNKGS